MVGIAIWAFPASRFGGESMVHFSFSLVFTLFISLMGGFSRSLGYLGSCSPPPLLSHAQLDIAAWGRRGAIVEWPTV